MGNYYEVSENKITINGKELTYELTRKDIRTVIISVKPQGLCVTAGKDAPIPTIEKILQEKSSFIFKGLEKCSNVIPPRLEEGKKISVLGKKYTVVFAKDKTESAYISGDLFCINYKKAGHIPKLYQNFALEITKKEVEKYLTKYYPLFQKKYGVQYPDVEYSSMISQWGNCNKLKNRLHFNTSLAFVPSECVEYIVIHELAHFEQGGHPPRFWEIVGVFCPNYKRLRSALSEYFVTKF